MPKFFANKESDGFRGRHWPLMDTVEIAPTEALADLQLKHFDPDPSDVAAIKLKEKWEKKFAKELGGIAVIGKQTALSSTNVRVFVDPDENLGNNEESSNTSKTDDAPVNEDEDNADSEGSESPSLFA